MTTDLFYLACTLGLAVVQILWADVARTRQYGVRWNISARDGEMPPLEPVAARLFRAQNNLFETLPLFFGAILTAHVAHRVGAVCAVGSAVYFWARLIYLPLYAYGVPQVRSVVWLVSFVGLTLTIVQLFIA